MFKVFINQWFRLFLCGGRWDPEGHFSSDILSELMESHPFAKNAKGWGARPRVDFPKWVRHTRDVTNRTAEEDQESLNSGQVDQIWVPGNAMIRGFAT